MLGENSLNCFFSVRQKKTKLFRLRQKCPATFVFARNGKNAKRAAQLKARGAESCNTPSARVAHVRGFAGNVNVALAQQRKTPKKEPWCA